MDKLDMFQSIFGKVEKIGCWDMERIQNESGTQFPPKSFRNVFLYMEYDLHSWR